MAEFFLELFSEEIPAGLQNRAAQDLARMIGDQLKKAGIEPSAPSVFATPHRLVVVIDKMPPASPDVREERKGPRVGAPEKALAGFMGGAGLKSIEDATIQSDPKKGDFYVAVIERKGRRTSDILAEIIPDVVRNFPWPKSMRWGSGSLKWVRPLHSVLCLLDGSVVKFDIDGIKSGNETRGHRFMGSGTFKVSDFKAYKKKLKDHLVILDGAERAEKIARDARKVAGKAGLALVEDEALLAETAGLVEWPVVLMGSFDDDYLDVPSEVLTTSMKKHQKCFSVADAKSGKLVNRFLLVSNLKAQDGGKSIIAGNERVIRARLSDAKFFWEQDLKTPLGELAPKLDEITFHEKLGTLGERVKRISHLAREIAPLVDADPDEAEEAAQLCKADLVTGMVGEFPNLQGLMGRYYAERHGHKASIARAIEDHYKPQGISDEVPAEPVAIAVALADKIDMLVGFWVIDEKPTGSKDPFALRRAALGIVRIVLENDVRLPLIHHFVGSLAWYLAKPEFERLESDLHAAELLEQHGIAEGLVKKATARASHSAAIEFSKEKVVWAWITANDLLSFIADRLKVHLRDHGARHDLIDAVFALDGQDDLLMIVKRVEALGEFLESDDGANLLAGVKRASNILRIEEKKDNTRFVDPVDTGLLDDKHEKALVKMIGQVKKSVDKSLEAEDFGAAMAALAKMRTPVDDFFDHVIVNAEDGKIRKNRLNLLAEIRETTRRVADFTKVAG